MSPQLVYLDSLNPTNIIEGTAHKTHAIWVR